jgi:hypothetical protein
MNRSKWFLLRVAAYAMAGVIMALIVVPYSILWLCTIPARRKSRALALNPATERSEGRLSKHAGGEK